MKITDKKFPQGCKRIAICMYGQYRTGDYMIPFFEKFFSNTLGVKIDIFCSTKMTRSYGNSPLEYINNTANESVLQVEKDELYNKLKNGFNPVKISIIDAETDNIFENNGNMAQWAKLFHGMSDSIRLKTINEHKNKFKYDLVFLCRYDVMLRPIDALDYYINWYNNCTIEQYFNIFNGNKLDNFIISHYLNHGWSMIESFLGLNDLFLCMSSSAADCILHESLRLLQQKVNSNSNDIIKVHDSLSNIVDGHNGLSLIAKRSNIGVSTKYPLLSHKNRTLLFHINDICREEDIGLETDRLLITVVREFFDLSLDPTLGSTCQAHVEAWVDDITTNAQKLKSANNKK